MNVDCEWCNSPLTKNQRRFCNQKCWCEWLRRTRQPGRKCEWCGAEFTTHKRRKTRFCDCTCSALWRNKHHPTRNLSEEERQKRRESIINYRKRPGVQEQLRENMRKLLAATPKGPTIPQKILFEALPESTLEYGLPNFMKIDIAIPRLKLAIEVDGQSHKAASMKERDA